MFPLVLKALKKYSSTSDALTDFFWDFHGKLELAKVKNVHPEVMVFIGQFYQEAQFFFNETFWCINNKPSVSKQELSYLKENDAPCFFWRVRKSYLNNASPSNEYRFRHNLQGCLNHLCFCNLQIEDTINYLLPCHHFALHCTDLMNSVKSVSDNFESLKTHFYMVNHV